MRLSDLAVNTAVIEDGAWVKNIPGLGDVELKVRGSDCAAFARHQAQRLGQVPQHKRENGRVPADFVDEIVNDGLVDIILLDWRGLLDDHDKPIPYSAVQARAYITEPRFRRFRAGVLWSADLVSAESTSLTEEAVGN